MKRGQVQVALLKSMVESRIPSKWALLTGTTEQALYVRTKSGGSRQARLVSNSEPPAQVLTSHQAISKLDLRDSEREEETGASGRIWRSSVSTGSCNCMCKKNVYRTFELALTTRLMRIFDRFIGVALDCANTIISERKVINDGDDAGEGRERGRRGRGREGQRGMNDDSIILSIKFERAREDIIKRSESLILMAC